METADPTPTPPPGKARVWLHLHGRELFSAWLLLIVPWVLVVWLQFRWHSAQRSSSAAALPTELTAGATACRPGPWGELEYARVTLEPPDEYVPYEFVQPQVRWLFRGLSRAQAGEWLDRIGLTADQRQKLAQASWEETGSGAAVHPPRELILQLHPAIRATLYTYLGQFPENADLAVPFRFCSERRSEWLANSQLSPATVKLVESLFYEVGSSTLFADSLTVFPMLTDPVEKRNLYKVLARKSALLVRLRVAPGAQVSSTAAYWSVGGRSKDIEPLLQSLARHPQGGLIDIMHLLPRHARSRINTYALPTPTAPANQWDCHWTSLNFFRDTPNDEFGTIAGATREIQEHYAPVLGNPKLGDLVLFFDDHGGTFHSCIYIADEIVFTKNGPSTSAPWVLMALPDVVATYDNGQPMHVRIYRRNGT